MPRTKRRSKRFQDFRRITLIACVAATVHGFSTKIGEKLADRLDTGVTAVWKLATAPKTSMTVGYDDYSWGNTPDTSWDTQYDYGSPSGDPAVPQDKRSKVRELKYADAGRYPDNNLTARWYFANWG